MKFMQLKLNLLKCLLIAFVLLPIAIVGGNRILIKMYLLDSRNRSLDCISECVAIFIADNGRMPKSFDELVLREYVQKTEQGDYLVKILSGEFNLELLSSRELINNCEKHLSIEPLDFIVPVRYGVLSVQFELKDGKLIDKESNAEIFLVGDKKVEVDYRHYKYVKCSPDKLRGISMALSELLRESNGSPCSRE